VGALSCAESRDQAAYAAGPARANPTFIEVSDGKLHDVNILDSIVPEADAFYVMDRAYVDFARLHVFHEGGAFFVTRAKQGIGLRRRCSRPVDTATGLRSDHTVVLASTASRRNYPDPLRRIHFHDEEQKRNLKFLTNNFDLPATTVCHLYKSRWQVELFFKWIKQHLRIKAFYGYSEKCCENSGLDCRICLRTRRHPQEATCTGRQSPRNPTGAQPHAV
jgi:IS4 transposase